MGDSIKAISKFSELAAATKSNQPFKLSLEVMLIHPLMPETKKTHPFCLVSLFGPFGFQFGVCTGLLAFCHNSILIRKS